MTNKYSFKQWFKRKYPDLIATPVYGINAYIITGPMDEFDAFTYYQTTLDNGQYIVFIGMTAEEISKTISSIKKDGLPDRPANNRRLSEFAPTTFTAFEAWLERNHITYVHRTFQPHKSPQEILTPFGDVENIKGCLDVFLQRTWYLYEIDCDDHYFPTLPHITLDSGGTAVLVKASSSRYRSKKERLSANFNTMQSYKETLIVSITKGDVEMAMASAKLYCSVLYECPLDIINVDFQAMKEELDAGKLGIYLRDKAKRVQPREDTEDSEDF